MWPMFLFFSGSLGPSEMWAVRFQITPALNEEYGSVRGMAVLLPGDEILVWSLPWAILFSQVSFIAPYPRHPTRGPSGLRLSGQSRKTVLLAHTFVDKKLEEAESPYWTKAPDPCQHMGPGPEIKHDVPSVAAARRANDRSSGLVFFQL